MPNMMKPNALDGAKMPLLNREACGTGACKWICRNNWVMGLSIRLVYKGSSGQASHTGVRINPDCDGRDKETDSMS